MKIRKYQSDDERSILTGMIVNSRVLGRVHAHLRSEKLPFRSRWSNMVGKWCLDYFEKYQRAPRAALPVLFRQFAESSKDEETVQLVEKFLGALSDDYKGLSKELNEDHLIDVASRFFNQVKIERLNQLLEADLLKRDVATAYQRVASFNPVNLSTSSMIGVLTDEEVWKDAVAPEEEEVLVQYPGALGEFFGPHLQRDGFIAFLAPEKRGKSFWLIDLAWRAAVKGKRKTLLYSVGDMSQRQMMRRLVTRAMRRPIHKGEFSYPVELHRTKSRKIQVDFEVRQFEEDTSLRDVKSAMEKIRTKTAHSSSLLRMRCTSNSTTRVVDIRSDLDECIREGWVPDVVVIDYADILAPESGTSDSEYRHQINETWKALRRLSQDYHVLVVTATQSDADSYDKDTLKRGNFSEDKRKLAHVTGMVGINQTEEEKEQGLFRLNWILLREGIYYESRCVTVAGSLILSDPAILSVW